VVVPPVDVRSRRLFSLSALVSLALTAIGWIPPSVPRQRRPVYTSFVKLPAPTPAAGSPFSDVLDIDITSIVGATYGVEYGGIASLLGSFGEAQGGRALVFDVPSWQLDVPNKQKLVTPDLVRLSIRVVSWTPSEVRFVAPTAEELGIYRVKSPPAANGMLAILASSDSRTRIRPRGNPIHWPVLAGVPDLQIGTNDVDKDQDGHRNRASGGDDCDDLDANRFPGNVEVPDESGHDEDCDPTTYGCKDKDGDGFCDHRAYNTDSSGNRYQGDDCDDDLPSVHPGQQPEGCVTSP
jgi:Putative metal-binding motif